MDCLVKLSVFHAIVFQQRGFHAAADVHADKVRNDFIFDRHGSTDSTAHACVSVRHYADFTAGHELLIEKVLNLRDGALLGGVGKHLGGIVFSF